jgi:hypothetical protein
MGSSPHYPMIEQEKMSAMNRLVESTNTSLDEHATLVVSPVRPFYSAVLLLWVTRVALLGDHKE